MANRIKNKWNNVPLTVKVSASYAICSILQKCLSFITLPLFTKLLTKEQYGQYTVYASWSVILSIFITLNLAYGSFSTAMTKYEDNRDQYISTIQCITVALAAIFLCIYLPFHRLWNKLFQLPTGLVVLMVFEIIFSNSILLWSGKKRFEFKYKSVLAVSIASSITGPVFAYFLVINTEEKGIARIIGYVSVTILVGIFFFIYNTFKSKVLFKKEFAKYALGFNLPLIVYYLSQVVFNQSDRIMIDHISGRADAATYGIAYNFSMVLSFVLGSINNSYVPWFYKKIKEGNQRENRTVSCGIAVFFGTLLLGIIWFGPEIIKIMAGEQYLAAVYVIPPVTMSLLLLFYSQLFINVEFYYEQKKSLVGASIAAALANIVLNYLFITEYGYIAAGYTTLVSYILFAACNYFAMRKILKNRKMPDDAYNYPALIGILGMFIFLSIAGVLLYNYFIIRISIAMVLVLFLFIKRKSVFKLIKIIRSKETISDSKKS